MLLLTPSVSGLFKWRQFEPEVILLAVGWYLRFSLSLPRRGRTHCRTRTTDPRQLRVGLYERARSLLFLTISSPCGRFKRTDGSPTTFIGFDAMVGDEPQRLDQ
jgi:hypothetical protein